MPKPKHAEKPSPENIIEIPKAIPTPKGDRSSHLTKTQRRDAIDAYNSVEGFWEHEFNEPREADSIRRAERIYNYLEENGFDTSRITLSKNGKKLTIVGPSEGVGMEFSPAEVPEFTAPREERIRKGMPTREEQLAKANKAASKLISALKAAGLWEEAYHFSAFLKEGWSKDGEIMIPRSFRKLARGVQAFLEDAGYEGKVHLLTPREERHRETEIVFQIFGKNTRDASDFDPESRIESRPALAKVPKKRVPKPAPITRKELAALNKFWAREGATTLMGKLTLLGKTARKIAGSRRPPKAEMESFSLQYRGLYNLLGQKPRGSALIEDAIRKFAPMMAAVQRKLNGEEKVIFPQLPPAEGLASR